METPSIHHYTYDEFRRQLLMRYRNNAYDLDIVVDDARDEVQRALERLRAAIAARDANTRLLADLVADMAA
jgi:hypothetical protein